MFVVFVVVALTIDVVFIYVVVVVVGGVVVMYDVAYVAII